jgi:hypothetical protein
MKRRKKEKRLKILHDNNRQTSTNLITKGNVHVQHHPKKNSPQGLSIWQEMNILYVKVYQDFCFTLQKIKWQKGRKVSKKNQAEMKNSQAF